MHVEDEGVRREPRLQRVDDGPHKVFDVTDHTVVILRNGLIERVFSSRLGSVPAKEEEDGIQIGVQYDVISSK